MAASPIRASPMTLWRAANGIFNTGARLPSRIGAPLTGIRRILSRRGRPRQCRDVAAKVRTRAADRGRGVRVVVPLRGLGCTLAPRGPFPVGWKGVRLGPPRELPSSSGLSGKVHSAGRCRPQSSTLDTASVGWAGRPPSADRGAAWRRAGTRQQVTPSAVDRRTCFAAIINVTHYPPAATAAR